MTPLLKPQRGYTGSASYALSLDDEKAATIYSSLAEDRSDLSRRTKLDALESWAKDKIARDSERQDAEFDRMYNDLPGWWKETGDDLVDEEVKLRTVNRKFIASQFGSSPEKQIDLYPSFRNQWTLANFGKKDLSESETFNMIRDSINGRKQINQSLDMITGDVALALFDQADKGKPVDVPTLVSKWKEENADLVANLPDQWEPNILKAAGEYYADTEKMLRDHGDVVQRLYAHMVKATGREVEGAPENDPKTQEDVTAMIDELAALPQDVRDRAKTAILMAAKRQGMEDKTFGEMAGEAWVRSLNMVRTTGLVAQEMEAQQRLALLKAEGPVYRDPLTGGILGQGGALQAQSGQAVRQGEPISDEDRLTMVAQAEQDLARLNVIRELRDFADNRFDPVKANAKSGVGQFFQNVALLGPQSLAYTAMAAVPVAGPVLTGAAIFSEEYNQLRNEGFQPDQAKTLAAVSAPIQSAAEVFGAKLIFGRYKWYRDVIQKMVNPARFARAAQGTVSFFGKVLGENATEATQDLTTPIVQDLASRLSEDYPEVDWQDTLSKFADSRLDVFAATLMPIIGGHTVDVWTDNKRFKSYDMRDKLMYSRLGFTQEEKAYVEDATTPREMSQRYAEVVKNMPADRVNATKDKIAAEAKLAADTQLDPTTPTIETARAEDGRLEYIIRDETGQEVFRTFDQAGAEEAYMLTTAKSTAAQLQADRIATKDLVDWWTSQDENNVAREETTRTAQQELQRLQGLGDKAGIETLHRRISQLPASATGGMVGPGMDYSQLNILGTATLETVAEGVFRGVIALNESSRPKDALEEINHVFVRRAKAQGRVNDNQLREWITATEAVTGEVYAKDTFDDIVESMAVIAEAYAAQRIDQNAESQLPSSFVDYLKRLVQVLKEVLTRGMALRQGFSDGTLGNDYEQFLAESVGLAEQTQVDRARERTEQEVGAGQSYSIGSSVPAEPATTPIADGMVRKFHTTSADRLADIRKQGLTMAMARGVEGPKAIYGWDTYEEAVRYGGGNAPVVEYLISQKERDANPVYVTRDIPTNDIVAIHEPWHEIYRYHKANGFTGDQLRGIDENYDRAANALDADRAVNNYSIGALGNNDPYLPLKTSGGKYKGAPKWVNAAKTQAGRDAAYKRLRERLYELVREGAPGRYWYEDSGRAVLRMFNNDVVEAEKFIELLAIYSPQATVEVNTYFALRAYIQRAVNAAKEEFAVKTGVQDDKAKAVLYDNEPWAGRKTDNFYKNIMYVLLKELPAEEVAKLKLDPETYAEIQKPVTVDMWVYRAFGFDSDALTDVAGTGAFGFAERELNRIAEEMNAMLPEGEDPYLPHQIQAMLWTAIKARAETKEVKDLTEAQSMRAGDMKKVKNAQGKLVREFTDKEAQKRHMGRWIKNALDYPSDKLDVSMAAGAFDRFINSVSMRALWESVPSTNTAEGAAITKLSTAEKSAFTRQSRDIILDENGNDMLAAMLGVPINVSQLLSGGYGTGATPNVVTELFPNKPSGTYDDDTVRAYARAIQYIYRQDAVPWMRYIKFGAETENSYYAQSPKGSKRTFRKQDEARAFVEEKIAAATASLAAAQKRYDETKQKPNSEKKAEQVERASKSLEKARAGLEEAKAYVVRGELENFAVKLDFGEQLTPDFLDQLQQGLVKLHEYLGFTQVSPTEVIIANFRDADTGLPALTDEEFSEKVMAAYGQQADIQRLFTVGEYGPVHDWSADQSGEGLLSSSSRFTPDLLQWLRGRREVSDALQKEWAEGRGVTNYSIAAQPAIDRVVNALGTLDRDPLERIKVYEKAQQKFLQVMADNREALATMKMEGATGREIRRTKMLQAMGELDGLLSALPAEVRAKVGGYTTLATIGQGDAALAKFFIKRIEMIDRALERFLRDEYNTAAVELFRRARPQRDAPGEKPKGKLDPDVHDLFNTLKEATEWSAEQAAAYATSQIDRAESGQLNPSQAAHAFLVANTVELFADWENADSTQRAAAVSAGKEIFNRAYKANKQKLIAQRQKRGFDRADLSDDAGVTADDEKARQTRMKKDNSLPKKWENVSLNLVNFGQLMGYIFGPDSKVAKQLTDRQRKADNAKSDDIAKLSGEWDAFLAKLGKSTAGGHMLLFNMSRMDKQIDGIPYSQNQLMAITMMWMQPKGRQHMEGYMDSDGQPAGNWHYNQDFVNKAERQLSPEAKQIRDYLLRKYAEEYDSINKVYRKLYNMNLPQNAFYSPLVVESIRASSNTGVDPVTGAVFAPNANSPGALRSRGGAIAQPVFRDAVQTYFAHMLQMAHWKAYAEFNSEVAGVLGHRDTRMVVKGKAGEQASKVMGNWLDYFAMGGNKDAANQLAINEFLNRMTGNFATMALFGRVSTLALQITQLGAASAKMPTGAYLLRLGKLLSGQLSWKAALDSDYIQRRIKDMPPAVAMAMQGLRAEKPNMIRNAARALGQLISGFDGLATAGTYAMVYDYQLAQANKNGLAGQKAEEYAREATERIVDDVAQPTRAGTRSIYELNMTHPVARAAWAFSSESRKNFGMVLAANSGRNLSKALVYVVLLNGLVGGLIRSAFRDLRDDDDDEIFDEKNWGWNRLAAMLISDPLYGFPIIGEAAESAVYNAFGVYKPSGPLFDIAPGVPAAKRLAYDYPTGEKEANMRDIVRDVNRVLSTAGLFNSQIAAAASLSNLVKDVYEGVDSNLLQE